MEQEQQEAATEETLWCSGCRTKHPVSAFGVNRSKPSGHQDVCRESRAAHKRSERGKASTERVHAKRRGNGICVICGRNPSPAGRTCQACRAFAKERNAAIREKALSIIGTECAYCHLGGCEGPLTIDHITPVIRRRTTGYTSYGNALNCWVVQNPAEANKRLQNLCARHNNFKSDMPDDVARAKWLAKHPLSGTHQTS